MTNRVKGIAWILTSAFGFAMMNLFIPMAGDLPTIQKSFFRNLVAFIIAVFILINAHRKHPVKELTKGAQTPWRWLIFRSILGTVGVWCNFYAMDHLIISDASVLNKISPFIVLIFAAIFLKEPLKKFHLIAVLIAFFGVLFIIKPSLSNTEMFPYLIGLLGGVCAGAAYTTVRQLNKLGVTPAVVIIVFSGFSCLVSLPQLIFNFVPMTLQATLMLIAVGLFAAVGQFGITFAYKFAPATEISVFDYSSIIFTGILGYLFLNQMPDGWSILGYALIIFAGIMTFSYNRR